MRAKPAAKAEAPGPLGRRERRRLETREKLFATAMRLFAEHGFFEVTTEDITDAADVGQGTFFNYFPTKSHVLTVLVEKQLAKVSVAVKAAEDGKAPVREILQRLIHALIQEPARSHALARSLISALVSHDHVRDLMRNMLDQGRTGLVRICAEGQKRCEITAERTAGDLALAFQRTALGTFLIWAMQPKGDPRPWFDKAFEDFWTIAAPDGRPTATASSPRPTLP